MRYRPLGRTGMKVSEIGLGTMTWGRRNDETEAFEQMDYALDQGINLFDTAEMYPMRPSKETWGRTEEIIGNWFAQRGTRDKVVLATKMMGRTSSFPGIRQGDIPVKADAANVEQALFASLERLQTDWIDLFQLHWPDRKITFAGDGDATYKSSRDTGVPIEETLEALDKQVKAGRIRAIGLNNETPYGLDRFIRLAEDKNLPRVASVQNPYSLLNRLYENGLAEASIHNQAGLLAYSPIAGGALSGKYLGGRRPRGSRYETKQNSRFLTPKAEEATMQYVGLAKRYDVDPAQMAVAFTLRQPFLTSTLVGATNGAQLRNHLAAAEITLSQELLDEIRKVHEHIPNPSPQMGDRSRGSDRTPRSQAQGRRGGR